MRVLFDVPHLYYLPQYQPVCEELQRRGAEVGYVFRGLHPPRVGWPASQEVYQVPDEQSALDLYQSEPADWVIFGNSFTGAWQLRENRQTALLFHSCGTSVKNANLAPGLGAFHVRFVPGEARLPLLRELFPRTEMVLTGFAKLDPFFAPGGESPQLDLAGLGLDPGRQTLLYAPTFYPSSIERMSKTWPAVFSDCNIVIKPHDFTVSKSRYRAQRRMLEHWRRYPNVRIAEPGQYNLLPFMGSAHLMITDASSAIFEFAALNKGVVVCEFLKLRWSYRGPLSFRLGRRLDATTRSYLGVARKAQKPGDMERIVRELLADPQSGQAERDRIIESIVGPRDGQAARRVADRLYA